MRPRWCACTRWAYFIPALCSISIRTVLAIPAWKKGLRANSIWAFAVRIIRPVSTIFINIAGETIKIRVRPNGSSLFWASCCRRIDLVSTKVLHAGLTVTTSSSWFALTAIISSQKWFNAVLTKRVLLRNLRNQCNRLSYTPQSRNRSQKTVTHLSDLPKDFVTPISKIRKSTRCIFCKWGIFEWVVNLKPSNQWRVSFKYTRIFVLVNLINSQFLFSIHFNSKCVNLILNSTILKILSNFSFYLI